MDERRGDLGLTWDQLASAAGVSVVTLRRNAADPTGMRTTTRKGIERALHWAAGSIPAILAGEEPIQIAEESPAELDDELQELAELREMAETAQARAEESLAVARELFNRIEKLSHPDEHRSAQ